MLAVHSAEPLRIVCGGERSEVSGLADSCFAVAGGKAEAICDIGPDSQMLPFSTAASWTLKRSLRA